MDAPVFAVPDKLVKILNRDLKLAGIPKTDERGRTVDVHALRHSFGTLLSKGGVAPRTAQAAMRHSTIDLTMNTYTDPKLLDVHGALDTLPALPLNGGERNRERATGTADASSPLAPTLAPKPDKRGESWSIGDKRATDPPSRTDRGRVDATACQVNRKSPLTTAVDGRPRVETSGLEPPTPGLQSEPYHPAEKPNNRALPTAYGNPCLLQAVAKSGVLLRVMGVVEGEKG